MEQVAVAQSFVGEENVSSVSFEDMTAVRNRAWVENGRNGVVKNWTLSLNNDLSWTATIEVRSTWHEQLRGNTKPVYGVLSSDQVGSNDVKKLIEAVEKLVAKEVHFLQFVASGMRNEINQPKLVTDLSKMRKPQLYSSGMSDVVRLITGDFKRPHGMRG